MTNPTQQQIIRALHAAEAAAESGPVDGRAEAAEVAARFANMLKSQVTPQDVPPPIGGARGDMHPATSRQRHQAIPIPLSDGVGGLLPPHPGDEFPMGVFGEDPVPDTPANRQLIAGRPLTPEVREWSPHVAAAVAEMSNLGGPAAKMAGKIGGPLAKFAKPGKQRFVGEVLSTTVKGTMADLAVRTGFKLNDDMPTDRLIGQIVLQEPWTALEYLAGNALASGLGRAGQALLGKVPTKSAKDAMRFSIDETKKIPSEKITDLAFDSGAGAPRFPLKAATGAALQDILKLLLIGSHGTAVKAQQAARWINGALDAKSFKFVRLPSGEEYEAVLPMTALKDMAIEVLGRKVRSGNLHTFMDFNQPAAKWFEKLLEPKNHARLALLESRAPDVHALVLARKLSDVLTREVSEKSAEHGLKINGRKMFKWVEDHSDTIRKVYGENTYDNLFNFSNYAKYLDQTQAHLEKMGDEIGAGTILRLSAETGVALVAGAVTLPAHLYAWGMSHALMDSSGTWSRLFQLLPKTGPVAKQAVRSGVTVSADDPETLFGLEDKADLIDPTGLGRKMLNLGGRQ